MAESLLVRKAGGGLKIEETLQNFTVAAGQTITAGTFVDVIQSPLEKGLTYNFNDASTYNGTATAIQAIKLDDTRVVVLYTTSSTSATAKIIKIENNVVTEQGTPISVGTGDNVKGILLDTNKLFIQFHNTSIQRLIAVIVTVNNLTLTLQSDFTITNHTVIGSGSNLTKMSNTSVISSYKLNDFNDSAIIRIFNISNNTITSPNWYNEGTSIGGVQSVTELTSTKLLYIRTNSSGVKAGKIFDFSGTALSGGTLTTLYSSNSDFIVKKINSSLCILVDFGTNDNTYFINTNITNNTMTITPPQNAPIDIIGSYSGNFDIFDGKIGVISGRSDASGFSPFGTIVLFSISGTNITYQTPYSFTNFDARVVGSLLLDYNKIAVFYRNDAFGDKGQVIIIEAKTLITNTTAEKVSGLAKTGGTAGQTIEVYVNT